MKKISYGRQSITQEDIRRVSEALGDDYLTTGPAVKEFEEGFAKVVGAKFAVAVSSGTAALHVAAIAAGLSDGDELITTPMTFAASSNCAYYCGATTKFVDVHSDTGLIDEDRIEKAITPHTKAIIPVHYTGLPCNMERIRDIAKKHNLIVIEDACHAIGSTYKGSVIGDCAYSDMAIFSFHPVKHITTGEGGMITTNSKELYDKLCIARTHGIVKDVKQFEGSAKDPWYYEMQELGFNYRISDFQCVLGSSQLDRIDSFVKRRRDIAKMYEEAFGPLEYIETIPESDDVKNAYHLYVIRLSSEEKRRQVFHALREEGIYCQVHYIPVYWFPYYERLGFARGLCPNAEEWYGRILSIPMYPDLSDEDVQRVIERITALAQ